MSQRSNIWWEARRLVGVPDDRQDAGVDAALDILANARRCRDMDAHGLAKEAQRLLDDYDAAFGISTDVHNG